MIRSRRRRQYRKRKFIQKWNNRIVDVLKAGIRACIKKGIMPPGVRIKREFPPGGIELRGPVTEKENDYIVRTHEKIL